MILHGSQAFASTQMSSEASVSLSKRSGVLSYIGSKVPRKKSWITSGQTWLSALKTSNEESLSSLQSRSHSFLSSQEIYSEAQNEAPGLNQLCSLHRHRTPPFTPLYTKLREHSLGVSPYLKIGMFLKRWLCHEFHHVELYFFTDFNKTVVKTFKKKKKKGF